MASRWIDFKAACAVLGDAKVLQIYSIAWPPVVAWLWYEPRYVRTLFAQRDERAAERGLRSQKILSRAMFRRRNVLRLAAYLAERALLDSDSLEGS